MAEQVNYCEAFNLFCSVVNRWWRLKGSCKRGGVALGVSGNCEYRCIIASEIAILVRYRFIKIILGHRSRSRRRRRRRNRSAARNRRIDNYTLLLPDRGDCPRGCGRRLGM